MAVQAPEAAWNHDMFAAADQAFPFGQAGVGQAASSISTGTKLYISNLDYGVSNEDIKVAFFSLSSSFLFFYYVLCLEICRDEYFGIDAY